MFSHGKPLMIPNDREKQQRHMNVLLSYNTWYVSDKGKKCAIALTGLCTFYLKVILIGLDLLNIMHNVISVFGEIHCFNWRRKTDDIIIVKTMKRPQMHFRANKPSNNNNLAQYVWEKIIPSTSQ